MDITDFIIQATQNAGYSVIWSFILGAILGIACMQCFLPVAVYGAAEGNARKGFIFAALFNLPRLLMFVVLGIVAAVSTKTIGAIQEAMHMSSNAFMGVIQLSTGMVLILFAAELFGIINLDKIIASRIIKLVMPLFKGKEGDVLFDVHNVGSVIRGSMLSIVCALESSLILIGVWGLAILSSDPVFAFLAVFAFGVGNISSMIILAAIMGGSAGFLESKTKKNFRRYAAYIGSIIILYLGITHILIGLHNFGLI